MLAFKWRTARTCFDVYWPPRLPSRWPAPRLAPFANRLDQTAFYANGKKYNFDMELGNVRGPIPGTGFVNGNTGRGWQFTFEMSSSTKLM